MTHLFAKIIFILFLSIVSSPSVLAQVFFVSPSSGEYSLGREFSVSLKIESAGTQINAAQTTINFSADLLAVKSVSKDNSIFKLWPQEPVFSNSAGVINFSGGVPVPGFSGTGNVLTVSFAGKKEGIAAVSISGGAILAADGRGTNVMKYGLGGVYKITKSAVESPIVSPAGVLTAAKIFSTTHPNENQWYSNSSPGFEWENFSDTIGVSMSLDGNAVFLPKAVSEGILNSKEYSQIGDGIWYFHLRLQSKDGWSRTSSKHKISIDTTPPLPFDIKIDNYGDQTSPQPALYFEAKDDLSGIAGYEIKIDGEDIIKADMANVDPFVMPLQLPGDHKIRVWAIDKAVNKTESLKEAAIESILPPEILIYLKIYNAGEEIFYLEGRALPNTKVIVFFADEKDYVVKTWETAADKDGNWTLYHKELFKNGAYQIYAKNKDKRGAISVASEKKKINVVLKGIFFGPYLISFSRLINLLSLLIILLVLIAIYVYRKTKRERKKVEKETKEAEESLKKTFNDLRIRMAKKIEYLDSKQGFSRRERRVRDEIMEVLQKSENVVKKEIEDIENEFKK